MIRSLRSLIVLAALAECGVAQDAGTAFCLPNTPGVVNCPCSNPPDSGLGCNNFGDAEWPGSTGGALLWGEGISSISADTLSVMAMNETPYAFTVLLESGQRTLSGTTYGAGVCCLVSPMHLVYGQNGIRRTDLLKESIFWGWGAGDPPISGDIGAMSGQTTFFQALYRDPLAATPCLNANSTFNLTNAVSVTWVP